MHLKMHTHIKNTPLSLRTAQTKHWKNSNSLSMHDTVHITLRTLTIQSIGHPICC